MGIYAYTQLLSKLEQSPIAEAASRLYKTFEESPTGMQREDRDQDWALFHEYQRIRWEEIERPAGYFHLAGALCNAWRDTLLLRQDMLGVKWTAADCREAALMLRNYVAANPPLYVARRWSRHQGKWLPIKTKGGQFVPDTSENDRMLEVASMLEATARRNDYVYFC
jgi:hypothetical protein